MLRSELVAKRDGKALQRGHRDEFRGIGLVRRVVELGEYPCDVPALVPAFDAFEHVPGPCRAFFDHAVVPAAIVLLDYARDHALAPEMVFDLPARFARLADLEQRAAQPEAIAKTDVEAHYRYLDVVHSQYKVQSFRRENWEQLVTMTEDALRQFEAMEQLLAGRAPEQPLLRLVDRGLVILSGFTPSDASHVLGLQNNWNTEAAELCAKLTARTERRPGTPLAEDARALAQAVIDQLTVQSCAAVVEAVMTDMPLRSAAPFFKAAFSSNTAKEKSENLVEFDITLKSPLIGIGAPAETYYPEIARRLRTEFDVPRYADVCNAVGAVAGGVSQRVQILITSPAEGLFRVHGPAGIEDFNNLENAASTALTLAQTEARSRADEAGALEVKVETSRDDRIATVAGSFAVFIESTISATAFGRPRISKGN